MGKAGIGCLDKVTILPEASFLRPPGGFDEGTGIARVQVDSYRAAYAGIIPQRYLDQFSYEEQEQDWRDWITAVSTVGLPWPICCQTNSENGSYYRV